MSSMRRISQTEASLILANITDIVVSSSTLKGKKKCVVLIGLFKNLSVASQTHD